MSEITASAKNLIVCLVFHLCFCSFLPTLPHHLPLFAPQSQRTLKPDDTQALNEVSPLITSIKNPIRALGLLAGKQREEEEKWRAGVGAEKKVLPKSASLIVNYTASLSFPPSTYPKTQLTFLLEMEFDIGRKGSLSEATV